MSTSYYRLKHPVTHLRIKPAGVHDKIEIWISHGKSGTIVVPKDDTADVLFLFAQCEEDDARCPLRTHWGGPERGTVVTVNDMTLPDEACVVSEYGELLTVGEVKARDGVRRADGLPTELHGYERS